MLELLVELALYLRELLRAQGVEVYWSSRTSCGQFIGSSSIARAWVCDSCVWMRGCELYLFRHLLKPLCTNGFSVGD